MPARARFRRRLAPVPSLSCRHRTDRTSTGRHLVRALLRLFVGAVSANQAAGCRAENSVVSGHMACRAAHDGALEAALCLRRSAAGNHHYASEMLGVRTLGGTKRAPSQKAGLKFSLQSPGWWGTR